jgi:hypothetical protein
MTAYQIWTDSETNRLHLVIHRDLSEPEVITASQRVRAALTRLRPGFSVTIQQELDPPDPAAPAPERFSVLRLRRSVGHILRAVDPALVA